MKLEEILRNILNNCEPNIQSDQEVVQGIPGQNVFWLIEELINFNSFDIFLDLVQHGQEILWKNDDIFPFIIFYVLSPFLIFKQFAMKKLLRL